jgi:hypothetical protein
MLTDPLDFLLTQREYAILRRCSERTIKRERVSGAGCRYIKIGRSVRYKKADVLDFVETHARHSTSETATAGRCCAKKAERQMALQDCENAVPDFLDPDPSF